MSTGRRIFYNTLAQTSGKFIAIAIGLLTLSLLTRHLQELGFGQYATVLALMGFVAVLADLGLYLVVVREISGPQREHNTFLSNILGLRLTTALTALIAGALIAQLFPYDPIVKQTMFVAIGAFLFIPLNQALLGIFQKHLVTHLPTISEIIGRLINLALVFWFIQNSLSLPFFIVALVFGNATIFFINLISAKRYEKFGIGFNLKIWKSILRTSWPLAFAVILNLVYFKGDTIILSVLQNEQAVGIYSLPYKILEVLLAFPAMFVGVVMPLLSRHAITNLTIFKQILQKSFDAITIVAMPMVITTVFFAHDIIDLIKGTGGFADSPLLLQILIIATAIIFFGTLFGYAAVAVKKEKAMVWGYLAGAVVALILYFILIPRFSYFGAAIATVITELLVTVVAATLVLRAVQFALSLKILLRSLPAASVLITFFYLVSAPWIIEAIAGLIIYGLVLLLFRAIPLDFVREIIFVQQIRTDKPLDR